MQNCMWRNFASQTGNESQRQAAEKKVRTAAEEAKTAREEVPAVKRKPKYSARGAEKKRGCSTESRQRAAKHEIPRQARCLKFPAASGQAIAFCRCTWFLGKTQRAFRKRHVKRPLRQPWLGPASTANGSGIESAMRSIYWTASFQVLGRGCCGLSDLQAAITDTEAGSAVK